MLKLQEVSEEVRGESAFVHLHELFHLLIILADVLEVRAHGLGGVLGSGVEVGGVDLFPLVADPLKVGEEVLEGAANLLLFGGGGLGDGEHQGCCIFHVPLEGVGHGLLKPSDGGCFGAFRLLNFHLV
jgi:hypothetical protein